MIKETDEPENNSELWIFYDVKTTNRESERRFKEILMTRQNLSTIDV